MSTFRRKSVLVGVRCISHPDWFNSIMTALAVKEVRAKYAVILTGGDGRVSLAVQKLNGRASLWSLFWYEGDDTSGDEYTEKIKYLTVEEVAAIFGLPAALEPGVIVQPVPSWVTPEIKEAIGVALDI